MTETITKLFDNYAGARKAARDLGAFAVPDVGIAAVAPSDPRKKPSNAESWTVGRDAVGGDRPIG